MRHARAARCLGPCAAGYNALLQLHGRSIWLKDLNDPALVPHLFDNAHAMLDAGTAQPVSDGLRGHVYERYVATPDGTWLSFGEEDTEDDGGLDRIDPVCLMEVDPSTARHTVEYDSRTFAFSAPSCKNQFLADPPAYLVV